MKLGRNDPCPCGSGKKYKSCCLRQDETRPSVTVESGRLVELFHNGRYAELESRARELLGQAPETGVYWKLLGAALQMQGKDALAALQKAAELLPDDAEAQSNLGAAWQARGQWVEAEASLRKALALRPAYAEASCNLGNALKDGGRLEEAVTWYRRALQVNSGLAEVHYNLGAALQQLGQYEGALTSYHRALEITPGFTPALNSLASLFLATQQPATAFQWVARSLLIHETKEAKALFVECVKRLQFSQISDELREQVVRALSEPWGRPGELARAGAALVKREPSVAECVARAAAAWPQRLSAQALFGSSAFAGVAADRLLLALLEAAPVCDIELERFLTLVRHAMLEAAAGSASPGGDEVSLCFYAVLARQCFINEYVFAVDPAEAARAEALRESVCAALETGAPIPALRLVVAAAYFPLYSLPQAERLLEGTWPAAVSSVLIQQVSEPKEERQWRARITQLTTIEDVVSRQVQHQYEAHPYPRWLKTAPAGQPQNIDGYLRRHFPGVAFRPLGKGSAIDILIAGCGTGQQSIETAQRFPGARLLAVDLSLSSLGYAKRKSEALGLTHMEYAQADILQLGSLGRDFDLIESSGVLHHLAEPWTGWRVLLSLLRPGGFMRLGFYSETARRDVVRARALIAEQGYGQTVADIRDYRQYLMAMAPSAGFGALVQLGDFFSTSACRDLLFHVQEHRMTLADIAAFLQDNDLHFLGFQLEAPAREAYRLRFPDDRARTRLDYWQVFEEENPDTFIGMYQFWVQKAG